MHDITKQVKESLAADEVTQHQEISVRMVGGVAFLDGLVDSSEVRERAQELAKGVEGVQLVRNRLQVRKSRDDQRREQIR